METLNRLNVTVTLTYPAPEATAPKYGTIYYIMDLKIMATRHEWKDTLGDNFDLSHGLVHLTRENAVKHRNAVLDALKTA